MSSTGYEDFKLYHYDPSIVAAIIFVILFIVSTAMHTWQLVKHRVWYFIPFLFGGFFEWLGYVGRAISSTQTPDWTLGPYIMQTLLLLLAPALFAASIYMILGRIIILTDGETHSLIKRRWLTKLFVAGDVLSFLMQSAGGGILAKAADRNAAQLGENVIVGGLFVQIVVFSLFIVVGAVFHYRIALIPTTTSKNLAVPWQRYLWILYIVSALILIRSIFRAVEYLQGQNGVLLQKEYYLYIFDAVLMWLAMVLLNFYHPSTIIKSQGKSTSLSSVESGATELSRLQETQEVQRS